MRNSFIFSCLCGWWFWLLVGLTDIHVRGNLFIDSRLYIICRQRNVYSTFQNESIKRSLKEPLRTLMIDHHCVFRHRLVIADFRSAAVKALYVHKLYKFDK